MNTWLFEHLVRHDTRSDRELVAAWLEKEYGAPPPDAAAEALLDAERLADEGTQWGGGINHRYSCASLYTTTLYWVFDGFIRPEFPYAIAAPDRATIEKMNALKHEAHDAVRNHLARIEAARPATASDLYEALHAGWETLRTPSRCKARGHRSAGENGDPKTTQSLLLRFRLDAIYGGV
jgi:hypothetical protein